MKTKKVFTVSLLFIVSAIVLVLAPFAAAYGSYDYFKQSAVDGISTPEFWVIFLLGFLFAFVLIASVSFAIAMFKLAEHAVEEGL